MPTNDYGTRIARARAQRRYRGARAPKPPAAPKRKPATTVYETYPLDTYDGPVYSHIDWANPDTICHAAAIADRYSDETLMQLVCLPTGFGKTAIAVATLGQLQHQHGGPLPFIVTAPPAVVSQHVWHATLAAWNAAFPDNPLNPYLIDTPSRTANIVSTTAGRDELRRVLGDDGVIIIDEVHGYKNPTSKRSKALQKLAGTRVLGISATPLTNNIPFDVASYLIMAGMYKNKTDYITRTNLPLDMLQQPAVYDRETGRISDALWPAYTTVKKQLSRVLYRPNVSTVNVDMPAVTNSVVNLDDFDTPMYGDVTSLITAYKRREFDSITDLRVELMRRVYTDTTRTRTIADICGQQDVQQPLVFYYNTFVADAISDELDTRHIAYQRVSGTHPIDDVDMTHPGPILVQYQSGGEGVEFPTSNTTVFAQPDMSYVRRIQAAGRNVRRGMTHPVVHYTLMSTHPFDAEVCAVMERRADINDEVLDEIAQRLVSATPTA